MAEPVAPSPREIAMIPTNIRVPFIFPSSFGKCCWFCHLDERAGKWFTTTAKKISAAGRYYTKRRWLAEALLRQPAFAPEKWKGYPKKIQLG
jgi:hypothetical protein